MDTFASLGLDILKRSTLQVLYEQHKAQTNGLSYRKDLSQEHIRLKLSIPKAYSSNKLVRGILDLLYLDGYVDGHSYRTGCWEITQEGISLIEN